MLGIKKIDTYIVKSFLAYFFMTFFISMLILLMQFTWKHMAELIGKGVSWGVLAEFFWYATLQTVPMALPLAILLAALMNFGNLGEHFELTAMKSAGISAKPNGHCFDVTRRPIARDAIMPPLPCASS